VYGRKKKRDVIGKVYMSSKVVRSEWLGERVIKLCVGENTRNCVQYFLTLVLFTFCTCCILRYLVCFVVVVLCVLLLVLLCVFL
jgi:hypothetical protein